jgi:hypothetical protein
MADIALAIISGTKMGQPDFDVMMDKIAAASAFTHALDTPEEIFCYRGEAAAEIGRTYLGAVEENDLSFQEIAANADRAVELLVSAPVIN